ncbi:MAG: diacylglycerol kinase family protein [Spirochaetota bacterium]|nr:diacylglycerol kinase family protein [Spirochaetota bacterium]
MKKRINSFKAAFVGIREGFFSQWNIKFHLLATLIIIVVAVYFHVSAIEWSILLLCCSLVISFELINTALEKLCDYIEPNKNEKIRIIKDISAAAVLISAIGAAVIGGIIFFPKLLEFFN